MLLNITKCSFLDSLTVKNDITLDLIEIAGSIL